MTKKKVLLIIAALLGGLVFGWLYVYWQVSRGIWGEGWFRAHAADMPKDEDEADEARSLEREPED